jgi:GR25 family glycosyltransferase involved in LPS biosynthesis
LINLDIRTDRLKDVSHNLQNLKLVRIKAVDGSQLPRSLHFVNPNVAACWLSHQKAFRSFLETNHTHCVIFEDDAVGRKNFLTYLGKVQKTDLSSIDFLQLGFLTYRGKLDDGRIYFFQKIFDSQLYFLRLNQLFFRRLTPQKKIYMKLGIKVGDVQAGSHAYVISRRLAKDLLEFNNPVFLATDLVFMSLKTSPQYSIFRKISSIVNQTDSPSSIK